MPPTSVVSAHAPVPVGTLLRLARSLAFFRDWSVDELKAIAPFCTSLAISTPTRLFQLNGLEPFSYFLLQGEVRLEAASGEVRVIRADEVDAGFPIARARPSQYSVTALQGAELLRVESSKLRSHQARSVLAQLATDTDAPADEHWRTHPLVTRLIRQVQDGRLALPAMPGIAARVRTALGKASYRLDDVVAIINADPAIAARLLKVANSALFSAQAHCETVKGALLRLGVEKTQGMMTSLLARDLFAARTPALKKLMLTRWRHAIDIAAICAVLARLTPGLQFERAMLVGLLHEVGVLPVIRMAEAYPDLLEDEALFNTILCRLGPELSAMVLEQWGFEDDYCVAARHQNHWFRDHDGKADYTDVLIIAHLHLLVHDRAQLQLPRIDEVPAYEKLALGKLTPELSLQVLEEARQQIHELKSLLA